VSASESSALSLRFELCLSKSGHGEATGNRLIFAFISPIILKRTWPNHCLRKPQEDLLLTVTIDNLAHAVVLRCHGRIVRGEESALLCAAVKHHGRNVVLDLGGVSAIDAAGVGALVSLQAAGVYLKLMNPTESVRAVLRLMGLEKVFEVFEIPPIEGRSEAMPNSKPLRPKITEMSAARRARHSRELRQASGRPALT